MLIHFHSKADFRCKVASHCGDGLEPFVTLELFSGAEEIVIFAEKDQIAMIRDCISQHLMESVSAPEFDHEAAAAENLAVSTADRVMESLDKRLAAPRDVEPVTSGVELFPKMSTEIPVPDLPGLSAREELAAMVDPERFETAFAEMIAETMERR